MLRAKNVCLFTTFVQSNTVLYKVDDIKNRIVKKKKLVYDKKIKSDKWAT